MINPQMIATAINLINQFGSTIEIQTASSTSYNVATGQIETVAGASLPIKASIESYSSEEIQGLIQVGDIRMTLANDNLSISLNEKIVFKGTTYNVINIQPLYLEDVIVIYELTVRK